MYIEKICKVCGTKIRAYNTIQNKCRECTLKNAKPIPQRGKQARLWEAFRDKIARPYLDKNYGHVCCVFWCMETENLDVDHIKNKGSHSHLRFDVKNMQYLCRIHHGEKTDGKLRRFKKKPRIKS